jgi:chromosome segregation ATPase
MMKIKQFIWILLALLISVIPASAEFYRFVDENGNTVYTDDINKVPVEQRENVQSYEEALSDPAEATDEKHSLPETVNNNAATADENPKERERLQAQEKELSREYQDLMTQRARLDEEKSQAISGDQISEYNQKIAEFNARIQSYEKKRSALESEINAFNQGLENRQKEGN